MTLRSPHSAEFLSYWALSVETQRHFIFIIKERSFEFWVFILPYYYLILFDNGNENIILVKANTKYSFRQVVSSIPSRVN